MSRSTTIYETDVYGGPAKIPAGYEAGEFRQPRGGETYLSAALGQAVFAHGGRIGDSEFSPRLILTKTPTRPPMPETAPAGYEFTGEYRRAETGDYVQLSPLSAVDKWTLKDKTSNSYWILRPLPTPESTYSFRPIVAPQGYELGEFRKLVRGEQVTFMTFDIPATPTPLTLTIGGFAGKYVYILKPIPPPESVYGTKDVKAPSGYELGEFRVLRKGDNWLNSRMLSDVCCDAKGNEPTTYRYIVHKLPTPADVYGCDPDAPRGYRKVEFRKLKVGETATWINRFVPDDVCKCPEVTPAYILGYNGSGYVWIVEPIPAPAPAPKFKVGDRVRYKSWDGRIRKATVTGLDPGNKWGDTLLRWDDMGNGAKNEADMELDDSPTPPCPAPSGFRYSGEYRTPGFADIYLADGRNSTPPYRAAVCTDNHFTCPKHILVQA